MMKTGLAFSVAFVDCPAKVKVNGSPFSPEQLKKWKSWLHADELQRVAEYRKQADQELFIARRGLARQGIAQHFNLLEDSIQLTMEPTGKLRWSSDDLDNQPSSWDRQLDFSISRASGIVALATCESASVGVDIESIGALPELEILAQQNLHPVELQIWNRIPRLDRTVAYYQLWVVKEAFAKALGVGLAQQPNRILSKDALTGESHGTVESMDDDGKAIRWCYWMTSVGEMHRLAVVTQKT